MNWTVVSILGKHEREFLGENDLPLRTSQEEAEALAKTCNERQERHFRACKQTCRFEARKVNA